MKYMVMECHLSYAVVLGEDGTFLKVANLHYQVGQTVTDVVKMCQPEQQRAKKAGKKAWYFAAAMAACLMLTVTALFQTGGSPYGSVYLTINPAVRIDVNRNDIVVGIEGTNADGEDLIENYAYARKSLELVMDELVDRAISMGFLHEGGQITLTLDAEDDQWILSHSDTLPAKLNEYLTEKISVTITVTDVNAQNHEIIIPITPGEGRQNDTDTGEAPAPSQKPEPTAPSADSFHEPEYKESDYGPEGADVPDDVEEPDDADTDYGPGDAGVPEATDTDYGPGDAGVPDDADTDYGPGDADVPDDADTDYGPGDADVPDDADTDYGPEDAGVPEDVDADYGSEEDEVTEYADTDYGPVDVEEPDDADTDYDPESDDD